MTTPAQDEQAKLEAVITALAYAQSAQVVLDALGTVPGVTGQGLQILLKIPQVRGLMRLAPEAGAHAATQAMYRLNLVRRATYLAAAARRMSTAAELDPDKRARALVVERRYLEQHLQADAHRTVMAQQVGATARQLARQARKEGTTWNGLVGWYAVMDHLTSAECRRAHRRNFDPTKIPPIGLPGTVHPSCRCKPGPPIPGAARVEKVFPEPTKAATSGRHRAVRVSLVRG